MGYEAPGMRAFMGVQLTMHVFMWTMWMTQSPGVFSGRDKDAGFLLQKRQSLWRDPDG
jgi:hypothetical protein